MTVSDIVKKLEPPKLAEALGLPRDGVGALRVRAWGYRGSIPGEYWAAITAYSQSNGLGITLEVLAEAHAVPTAVAA